MRTKKTHYITLRLVFDEPQTTQEAVTAATYSLINEKHSTVLPVRGSRGSNQVQKIAAFRIKRVC